MAILQVAMHIWYSK